jgi:hypothetical protein
VALVVKILELARFIPITDAPLRSTFMRDGFRAALGRTIRA